MNSNSKSNWGVVVFPGSNCDHDGIDALGRICGQNVKEIWHKSDSLEDVDGIMLPGGFSYGDYLRAGAIARFATVMDGFQNFLNNDGLIIGVCNGFQVLTEAGILPGVLMRNVGLRFICREIFIRVERNDTVFTSQYETGQVLRIPIAHNEGNYFLPESELSILENNKQVVFRYCDENGEVTPDSNPNGSINNIAGIINETGRVLGMMPHPERRCDPLLGRSDGLKLFLSASAYLTGR